MNRRWSSLVVTMLAGLWLAMGAFQQGITDDDDYYVPAGIRMVDWLGTLLRHPIDALSRAAIDAAFGINHEHPPFAKLLIGLGARLGEAFGLTTLVGARLGIVAITMVMVWALLQMARRRIEGMVAVAMLITLPRFAFHATVPTLDVAVAATMVVTAALWVRSSQWSSTRAFVVVGISMAVALSTKLNAPFLVVPMAGLWMIEHRRRFRFDMDGVVLPRPPAAMIGACMLGPLLFVLCWPWLWGDLPGRLVAYAAFHLRHYPILMWFDGVIHDKVLAPWHAPWRIAVAVMPVTVVGMVGLGAWPVWCAARRFWHHPHAHDRWLLVCAVQAAAAMATISFSPVPVYGGEKLFMPFFPFVVVVGAAGVRTLSGWVVFVVRRRRPMVMVLAAMLVCAPGVVGQWQHRGGHALSYFGAWLGGIRGAIARGWEGTYYDVADRPLAEWLAAHAGNRKVHFAPNHKEYVRAYRWWQREGVATIQLTDRIADAQWVVLSDEARWSTLGALQSSTATWTVIYETTIDGVVITRVLERPERDGGGRR
jgi:hypothetical protein